jgi:phosphatidylinositol alpha-1,6-mannosyltransferase
MKTLLVTLEYPPFKGGVAQYYYNLAMNWPEASNFKVLDNSEQELMGKGKMFPWLKAVKKIWSLKRGQSFDYLIVGHILPLGTVAYLTSLITPFKYTIVLHGLDLNLALRPRKKFITRLILKRSDKIICANSRVAEILKQAVSGLEDKVRVVNPGVDISSQLNEDLVNQLRNEYKLNSTFSLLSIGRLVERKGFDRVIEALAKLEGENIKYFIIGQGQDEFRLKQIVKDFKQDKRVIFLGSVSEEEKLAWLHASDTFIMPSRQIGADYEGFGIVYLEANQAGLPVIAGRSGGVADAVVDNVNGLMLNPENIAEISLAIAKLIKDKDLRFKLAENGKKRVREEFSWKKQAKKFQDLINN